MVFKNAKRAVLLITLLFFGYKESSAIAGTNPELDSLKELLVQQTQVKSTIENLICHEYWRLNLDSAEHYAQLAMLHAIQEKKPSEHVKALTNLGVIENLRENLEGTEKYLLEALSIARSQLDSSALIPILANLALTYSYQHKYLESLEINYQLEDQLLNSNSKDVLGKYYINVSNVFGEAELFEIEEVYLKRSLDVTLNQGNKELLASIYYNLGALAQDRGHIDSAHYYFNLSTKHALTYRPRLLPSIYRHKAQLAAATDLNDSVIYFHRLAIKIADSLELPLTEGELNLSMAEIHLAQNNINKAILCANKAKKSFLNQDQTAINELLYKCYSEQENIDSAFGYLQLLHNNSNTDNQHLSAALANMFYTREINKGIEKNTHLVSENKKTNESKKDLILYLLLSLAVLGIVLVSLISVYRSNQLKNQALKNLEESNKKLEVSLLVNQKFQQLISHDFRSPLTNIIMLLEIELEESKNSMLKDSLPELNSRIQSLLVTFDSVLKWSQMHDDQIRLFNEKISWKEIMHNAVKFLEIELKNKAIKVDTSKASDVTLNTDRIVLETILRNLLANAIRFSDPGSTVEIVSIKSENEFSFTIIDQGKGMTDEIIQKLLSNKMNSTEGTEGEKGSGIGFRLITSFVRLLNGQIEIESKVGVGTKIMVSFPIQ